MTVSFAFPVVNPLWQRFVLGVSASLRVGPRRLAAVGSPRRRASLGFPRKSRNLCHPSRMRPSTVPRESPDVGVLCDDLHASRGANSMTSRPSHRGVLASLCSGVVGFAPRGRPCSGYAPVLGQRAAIGPTLHARAVGGGSGKTRRPTSPRKTAAAIANRGRSPSRRVRPRPWIDTIGNRHAPAGVDARRLTRPARCTPCRTA